MAYHNIGAPHLVTATGSSELHWTPSRSESVCGSSVAWIFHPMEGRFPLDAVCVYAYPVRRWHSKWRPDSSPQRGGQHSVFSRWNISANLLDVAVAQLERHSILSEKIVWLERSTASIQWSNDHWALITPLTLLYTLSGESDRLSLSSGEQNLQAVSVSSPSPQWRCGASSAAAKTTVI